MQYLGVLITYADPRKLARNAGFEVESSRTAPLAAEPAGMGIVAQWTTLSEHDLLDQLADAETLAASIKAQSIPVTVRPLSRLRSVEGVLRAAEDCGMVYGDALGPVLDVQTPPSPLRAISDWLRAWGYSPTYDQETETLRIARTGQTCAVFPDGSIVGEQPLRDELEGVLTQSPERPS
ncbi:hypothetical protein [Halalkalicoccus sp. NIPERK01]|uniref:hypothetical protein n=1 Tax=Halalkalicoccus sp. NIPERK01 TaxID=3053469 RepID=UPI00256F4CBC|nr:hypothetical protein [Halalkalicoccus sp. NIPERK01]MDL5363826.1 hypothetical protein [Halalkalicoccus sp. NIPERK01]